MKSKWDIYKVQEICAKEDGAISIGPFGSRLKSDEYTEKGVPVIRGKNISDSPGFDGDFAYISEDKADSLGTSNVYKNELVFPHRGAIGKVGIVNDQNRYVLSSSLMKLKCNQEFINPRYVYYFFKSHLGRHELLKNSSQVGTPGIGQPLTSLKNIDIPIPPKSFQDQIDHYLTTLDQKIHLNQKTNQTLEAIAQSIFKSWFVDFDPVRAKIEATSAGRDPNRAAMAAIAGVSLEMDWDEVESALDQKLSKMSEEQRHQLNRTAQLFPDGLLESEIGEVPKGWGVKTAEEILKRYRAPKRVKKDEVEEAGKVVVLEQGEGIIMGYHNEEAGYDASPDNPYFIFGDHTCITHLVIEPFDIAPNVIPLQGEEFDSYWTYYAIRDLQQFQEYRRHWSELKVKEVVTPNNELDELFAEFIKPLIIKINKNRNENLTLSQLRDTLLPKLISGEVGV